MEKKEGNIRKNFSVPADYFDDLEQRVLSKTVDAPKAAVRKSIVKPWMAIAASVLMVFCITAAWMWNNNHQQAVTNDDVEIEFLEDELFAALIYEETENQTTNSLEELADFLIELEATGFD